MALHVATHNGPFHADDVLAFAMIRRFVDPEATVERTREPARLRAAEIVFDVGGSYDPAAGRFDHHQAAYGGELSSAGMVLAWLVAEGRVDPDLGTLLQERLVAYVDDVDNGRVAPRPDVPCIARFVEAMSAGCEGLEDFDRAYLHAAELVGAWVGGVVAERAEVLAADEAVRQAMAGAMAKGSNLIEFSRYIRWKPAYFAHGGQDHPTDFVLFPGHDDSWRVVCIPPEEASFAQKVPLPEAWAGLTGSSLGAVTGVEGAKFCHKNRFIAVFATRGGALGALRGSGLLSG